MGRDFHHPCTYSKCSRLPHVGPASNFGKFIPEKQGFKKQTKKSPTADVKFNASSWLCSSYPCQTRQGGRESSSNTDLMTNQSELAFLLQHKLAIPLSYPGYLLQGRYSLLSTLERLCQLRSIFRSWSPQPTASR